MSIWVGKELSIMYFQAVSIRGEGKCWEMGTTGSQGWKKELKAREVFAIDA